METDIGAYIRNAILHDISKSFKRRHDSTSPYKPYGSADKDAARLSRPPKTKSEEWEWPEDIDYLNQSYVIKKEYPNREKARKELSAKAVTEYLESTDSIPKLYEKLLIDDKTLSNFREHPNMPFTSLKYHTLLVAALSYNYMKGRMFKDLYLNYNPTTEETFTTIFRLHGHCLVIGGNAKGARIGFQPTMNFGDTISRLSLSNEIEYIIENLKRIKSWSSGLQYLEDSLNFLIKEGVM